MSLVVSLNMIFAAHYVQVDINMQDNPILLSIQTFSLFVLSVTSPVLEQTTKAMITTYHVGNQAHRG